MADLGWLGEIGKVLGGGAVGWAGRAFTERGNRRRMRRHLYKEMVYNYEAVKRWLLSSQAYRKQFSSDLRIPFRDRLVRNYYDHCQGQLDEFHDLEESLSIAEFYRTLEFIFENQEDPRRIENAALQLYSRFEECLASGELRLSVALEVAAREFRPKLAERIAAVKAGGQEVAMDSYLSSS